MRASSDPLPLLSPDVAAILLPDVARLPARPLLRLRDALRSGLPRAPRSGGRSELLRTEPGRGDRAD
jgi:hypothetical protein